MSYLSPAAEPFPSALRWGFPSLKMFQWLQQYHNAISCYEHLLWGRREKTLLSLSQTHFLICLSRHLFLSKREKYACNEADH